MASDDAGRDAGSYWLYGVHAVEAALANRNRSAGRLLLSEEASGPWLEDALREAERAGYKVKIARVPSHRHVRRGLAQLRGSVDAIWLLPDREVRATAIYEVTDGLITRVWFVKDS